MRFLPTPRDRLILEAVATHGRLTREHVRRLFFSPPGKRPRSPQAVNARLRLMTQAKLLSPVVASSGRGSGPYAYALTLASRRILHVRGSPTPEHVGPVWHQLEIADFRVTLEEEFQIVGGAVLEWQGEATLRTILTGQRGWPVPDAIVHWQLRTVQGSFALEWDRGTEPLAILTTKLSKYRRYWAARGHRTLLPGLGLRPRLLIVVNTDERFRRLRAWLSNGPRRPDEPTVCVGVARIVLADPLGDVWWRSDRRNVGSFHD